MAVSNTETNEKPRKFYVVSAVISIFTLILFLSDDYFPNVSMLIASSTVSLAPFFVDNLTFFDDTKTYKGDKIFKILRTLTGVVSAGMGVIFTLLVFVKFDILVTPSAEDLSYLCFKTEGFFNLFNGSFLYRVLSVNIILCFYIILFFSSVLLKAACAHFYQLKLKNERDIIEIERRELDRIRSAQSEPQREFIGESN